MPDTASTTTALDAQTTAGDPQPQPATPAWPTEEPDPPIARPEPTPQDLTRIATFELQGAFLALSRGEPLDPDTNAEQILGDEHWATRVPLLRELATEGRRRAAAQGDTGRVLASAGMVRVADHLDAVAGQLAAHAVPGDASTRPQPSSAIVATVYDRLTATLQAASVPVEPLPADRAELAAPIGLQLNEQSLRSPQALRKTLLPVLSDPDELDRLPAGMSQALSVLNYTLLAAGINDPAQDTARRAVTADRTPLHTAERLQQLAEALKDAVLSTGRYRLGTYENHLNLPEHLQEVANHIYRIAANPAALATSRVVHALGEDGIAMAPAAVTPGEAPVPPAAAVPEVDADLEPYRYDARIMPEHALLGSLLHAPGALRDLDFLGPQDFSQPDTQGLFATLRWLHATGSLHDVAAFPEHQQRLAAAEDNHRKLFAALNATPRAPGQPTHSISTSALPQLIAQINAAAPVESLPYRGVYDRGVQLRLGRMVLEDSIRQQLARMGVHIQCTRPLVAVSAQTLASQHAERTAGTLAVNLDAIGTRLDALAARLGEAVRRTGPDAVATAVPQVAAATVADLQSRRGFGPRSLRERVPDAWRRAGQTIAAPLRQRAERHIIHLAMHAGRLENVTPEDLALLQQLFDRRPEDFTSERHANTWRAIENVRAQGLPVCCVSVDQEIRAAGFGHRPALDGAEFVKLAKPPVVKPERIVRSLRTLVSASLARSADTSKRALATLAHDRAVPLEAGLRHAREDLGALAAKADTALTLHRELTTHQQRHRAATTIH
ncbi:DnaB-like helicase N-terminal domain-containing protein [Amycolatopsis tolypomycina]|uniref:DnaB-like helicase N-terminal domain-containing protein n=1 Tax=Amycolatopsis tolypomycina TaxID=208445 RepID=UPI0033A66C29